MDLTGRIIPPKKTAEIPELAQWLTGEGGGAWFSIQKEKENYRIQRFTPQGIMDCNRIFGLKNKEVFDENITFNMNHISHCALVRVNQNGVLFVFEYLPQ